MDHFHHGHLNSPRSAQTCHKPAQPNTWVSTSTHARSTTGRARCCPQDAPLRKNLQRQGVMPADLADQDQARSLTGPSIISSSVNAMRTVVRSTFLAVSMALLTFHGVPAGKAQSMMDQIIVSQGWENTARRHDCKNLQLRRSDPEPNPQLGLRQEKLYRTSKTEPIGRTLKKWDNRESRACQQHKGVATARNVVRWASDQPVEWPEPSARSTDSRLQPRCSLAGKAKALR